jgi:predicted 2-oxoglutarate/Fe(II)-dependent dioxygenase YbiX
MEVTHFSQPVQFCIINNYFTKDEVEVLHEELDRLELKEPVQTGTAQNITGKPLKRNKGTFVENKDSIIGKMTRKLFQEAAVHLKYTHWVWNYFHLSLNDSILVTRYDTGDYYKSHRDESLITAIYYTWKEPKTFTGGDLYFGEFKVPIRNNSLLIFPGPTLHEVTPVEGSGRWAISQFVTLAPSRSVRQPIEYFPHFLHVSEFKKLQDLVFKSKNWCLENGSRIKSPRFWKLLLDDEMYVHSLIEHFLMRRNLKVLRVYANGQFYGQNGSFHQDDLRPGTWTFLLYCNDIVRDEIDEWHGQTEFKLEDDRITSQQPVPNLGILFRSDIPHRGLAPSKHVTEMRVTVAWKLQEIVY